MFGQPSFDVILHFDGSALGNPGHAGSGYVLTDPSGGEICRGGMYIGKTTNNVAEYKALILGCGVALERGFRRIRIEGDSLLVINQVTGKWRSRVAHLSSLLSEAKTALSRFDTWTAEHIPRTVNTVADSVASHYSTAGKESEGGLR